MNFFFRKKYKRNIKNQSLKKNKLLYSNFGLKFLNGGILDLQFLEFIRYTCIKIFTKICKLYFRIFINQSVFKKSKNSRMGKGLGKFLKKIFNIKQGQILVELININNKYLLKNILNIFFRKISKNIILTCNIFFKKRYHNL